MGMAQGNMNIHGILREARDNSEDFRRNYRDFAGKYLYQSA